MNSPQQKLPRLDARELQQWLEVMTHPLALPATLQAWLEGPLRGFFPYEHLVLAYGRAVAGELRIEHLMTVGHGTDFVRQIEAHTELAQRGSLRWWMSNRRPFMFDTATPPPWASGFELDEVARFGLGNVVGHGVLNLEANAGSYFGFSGVDAPLSARHLQAMALLTPTLNDLFMGYLAARVAAPPAPPALSPREAAMVRLIASGLSNKRIARDLGISEKTVRNRLTPIYARLGVTGRAGLMLLLR